VYGTAQQNNNWYFGNRAGFNFNTTGGQPIPQIHTNSQITADEGSSTISDKNGNVLFYTNGVTIYNRQHQPMINGNAIGGNISACQAAIIIPQPGNDSIYYIFTTDAIENNFVNGYRYSIVNINRDNGNGEVISKNQLLWSSCTERLTAARHRNGTDVWVITNDNDSNIFRAWLLSCNGLGASPVVSTVGVVMNAHALTNNGYMKVSPDGKQLCQTHFPFVDPDQFSPNFVQLFSFDNATGAISNPLQVGESDAQYLNCEYSPNSELLYLTRPQDKKIEQLECRLPGLPAIHSSRVIMNPVMSFHGIQLAPDEKIYLIRTGNTASRIEYPNIKGVGCLFSRDTIRLYPGLGQLGSPSFINDAAVDPNHGFTYTILDSCGGVVQFNGITSMSGTISWAWDFGDGNVSTAQNPLHTFADPNQVYRVTVTIISSSGCGEIVRSRMLQTYLSKHTLSFDYTYNCAEGTVEFFHNTDIRTGESFEWDFGDGQFSIASNPSHTYAQAGNYQVTFRRVSPTTCRDKSVTQQVLLNNPTMSISPHQAIVLGQTVIIRASGNFVSYEWSPATGLTSPFRGSTQATPFVTTTYTVIATDSAGCQSVDSVKITVVEATDIFIPTGFTPGNDGLNDIIKPIYPTTVTLSEFSIYNRWGQKIYSTKTRGEGWNGRLKGLDQPPGVYVWFFKAKYDNGTVVNRRGTVTLIR
jgi:gliding motility-associated-like protein